MNNHRALSPDFDPNIKDKLNSKITREPGTPRQILTILPGQESSWVPAIASDGFLPNVDGKYSFTVRILQNDSGGYIMVGFTDSVTCRSAIRMSHPGKGSMTGVALNLASANVFPAKIPYSIPPHITKKAIIVGATMTISRGGDKKSIQWTIDDKIEGAEIDCSSADFPNLESRIYPVVVMYSPGQRVEIVPAAAPSATNRQDAATASSSSSVPSTNAPVSTTTTGGLQNHAAPGALRGSLLNAQIEPDRSTAVSSVTASTTTSNVMGARSNTIPTPVVQLPNQNDDDDDNEESVSGVDIRNGGNGSNYVPDDQTSSVAHRSVSEVGGTSQRSVPSQNSAISLLSNMDQRRDELRTFENKIQVDFGGSTKQFTAQLNVDELAAWLTAKNFAEVIVKAIQGEGYGGAEFCDEDVFKEVFEDKDVLEKYQVKSPHLKLFKKLRDDLLKN